MAEVKAGNIVRSYHKKGWYGVVFSIDKKPGHHYPQATVAVFCTADGRPYRKVTRQVLDTVWLEAATPPARFKELGGVVPTRLPDPSVPGGTPRRKFTDSYSLGDIVSITRWRHGWFDGACEGPIIAISDYGCTVRGTWDDHTHDYSITKPGDIRLVRRGSGQKRSRRKKK